MPGTRAAIERATRWPDGNENVRCRSRLRWANDDGLSAGLGLATTVCGRANSGEDRMVSIFLFGLELPSSKLKNVRQSMNRQACRAEPERSSCSGELWFAPGLNMN